MTTISFQNTSDTDISEGTHKISEITFDEPTNATTVTFGTAKVTIPGGDLNGLGFKIGSSVKLAKMSFPDGAYTMELKKRAGRVAGEKPTSSPRTSSPAFGMRFENAW